MSSPITLSAFRSFTLMICMYLLSSCGKNEYQGYVYDRKTHLPIKDVLVRYDRQQVRSDDKGYFAISNKDNVSAAITFSKKGYQPDTAETIVIHSGETMSERFKKGRDTVFLKPIAETKLPPNKQVRSNLADSVWPISSEQFSKFYKRDLKTGEYTLVVPQGSQLTAYGDAANPVQESPFGYEIKPGDRYLTAAQFNLSGTDCKIIIYHVTGENDSPVLNIQLNSYNKGGKLQDALLLDSRFTFEIEYYRDFIIQNSGNIKLELHEKENYTYNEQGDITGYIKDPQVKSSTVNYLLQPDGKSRKLTP